MQHKVALKCSNCDVHLCTIKYMEEDSVPLLESHLKISCQCPFCDDKSFPAQIPADKFTYDSKEATIINMDYNLKTKRVFLYAKRTV